MAAVMGRTEVGIKRIGGSVVIANNPRAKLMYYLDCICSVLDLSDTDNLARLRNYKQYFSLSEAETDTLVTFCVLLSPDELCGKVIFQDIEMCGNSSNRFYEISMVHKNLLVADSVIIGGRSRAVSKIMAFKPDWLVKYWRDPMVYFAPRLARITGLRSGRRQRVGEYTPLITPGYGVSNRSSNSGCCCIIL
ncbi:uncharacterized protein LOC132731687 [Ruditapes philippinarum]|uniref:uncharacterized protein LOC132731687 n=1 Tax=Ruditapes philippinarum TaxID=129788 RepID=UPI00295C1899|nr:uncharacterized protein LOC132731687 [Ruditapes philippinarum]XP_060573885.1 uncharacterized protein LOC132731687 [Ruditapes philippinarum]